MEMLAVIKGLEAVPEGAEVLVHSDSQYVVNTMTRNWRRNVNRDPVEQAGRPGQRAYRPVALGPGDTPAIL